MRRRAVFAVAVLIIGACQAQSDMPVETVLATTSTSTVPVRTTDVAAAQSIEAVWRPAPWVTLSPDTQTLDIVVLEQACSGGDNALGRIDEPEVVYTPDAVIVTIRVQPKPGVSTCQGNPLTTFKLELDEPLGSRQLLQAGERPPP